MPTPVQVFFFHSVSSIYWVKVLLKIWLPIFPEKPEPQPEPECNPKKITKLKESLIEDGTIIK